MTAEPLRPNQHHKRPAYAYLLPVTGIVLALLLALFLIAGSNQALQPTGLLVALFLTGSMLMLFCLIWKRNETHYRNEKNRVRTRGHLLAYIKEANKEKEKYRGLLEAAPDAIVIAGKHGIIELVNAQTEIMFGFSRNEMIGQKIEMLLPERFRGEHKHHRTTYFLNPKVRPMGEGYELFGKKKDGTEFFVEISLSPLITEDGVLVSAAIRDIGERKKSEAAIRSLNLELEKNVTNLEAVNRELEAFTYSVSHDLRAPLRIIDGFSSVLVTDYGAVLNEEGKRTLGVIRMNAQHMGRLIDDLLHLSRLGRQEMRVNMTDMNKMVQSVIAEQELLGHQAVFVCGDLQPAPCDSGLLRQVWTNLISNAIKFSSRHHSPEIYIHCWRMENEIIYSVKDNGVGFDMQYAGKLFGVFQRLHKITEYEGTGIGLALVHRIVTKHHGRVWSEAEVNKGATFFFSLPAVPVRKQQPVMY
jgi:PAS domain S-box-containing protein